MMQRLILTVAAILALATPAFAQLGAVPNVFVSGSTISSAAMNTNFSTIFSNALNRTGGTMTGTLTTLTILPTADNVSNVGSAGASYASAWFDGTVTIATLSATTSTLGTATATTLDTGFGANELYDMDQHVLTSSTVTFANATISTTLTAATINASALLTVTRTTGEQLRLTYDGSNYLNTTVGSTGIASLSATGSGAAVSVAEGTNFVTNETVLFELGAGEVLRFRNGATDGFEVSQLNTKSWAWTGLASDHFLNLQNASFIVPTGKIGIGTTVSVAPSAFIHVIGTTEQARFGYDSSNYVSTTVASNGATTLNAVGAGAAFSFSDSLSIAGMLNVTLVTEQMRLAYDGSNYLSVTVGSAGATIFNATGASATFTFSDTASFNLGIYERSRSVLMGEWQNQAFAAGDYTAATGNWTVDSGDVTTNRYTLVGKTVTWQIVVDATDVSATPLTLRVALPTGLTDATGLVRWGSCGYTVNAGAQIAPAIWSIADTGAVYIYRQDLSNWSTTASDNTGVYCTIIFETD